MLKQPTTTKVLIDEDLLAQFAKVGNQINEADPLVLAKFANHINTWYIISFDPVTDTLYTYCTWVDAGWFATLSLQDIVLVSGERDTSFIPCRLSEIKRALESMNALAEQQAVV